MGLIKDQSEELDMLNDRVTELENGTAAGVPDYWASEVATKARAIQAAMEAAGRKKSAFLWYTDAHWPNGNSKVSPKLLKYLYEHTPMNKVNFGGDIIGDSLLSTREQMEYLYEWREAIKGLPNHHSVEGNHDRFTSDAVDYEGENYTYTFLIAPEESADMVIGDGNYYYIDNPAEKTRYLYFGHNTGNQTALLAQAAFMAEALKTTPAGWHIVAISHIWRYYNSSSKPTEGGVSTYQKDILSVFDAYNARSTRGASNYFTAQDFTAAAAKVEFCIGGHIHVDFDFASDGGIPIIITTADTNQDRVPDSTVDSGTVGTSTEAAVFGIIADYNDPDNTKITVVGVGRGTSRVINGSESGGDTGGGDTPAAVNLFDKNNSDVTIGGRINSSGAAVSWGDGQLVTGFIPAAVGDTFTMKSNSGNGANNYVGTMACYKADKTFIGSLTNATTVWNWNSDKTEGTASIPDTYNSKDYSVTAYVRFCVAYTDIDNIEITKA